MSKQGWDYTIVHIEDDISSWRENPAKVYVMLRELVEEEFWSEFRIVHPPERYADTTTTELYWKTGKGPSSAQFIFTTDIGVESFAEKLAAGGELTFIVDARRPGEGTSLSLSLFDSFESIARHVKDSRQQVRVFTAYMDVVDQLNGMKKAQKKKFSGFHFPLDVIGKTDTDQINMYMLKRLGFAT
jgi:hypothetical protein